ncbi:hypothetical protein [Providencia sp.]|uniref:hypothetical protein n=1 Tax=Providencia sp. TaxID=589 RepID=UPI003F98C9E3
MKSSHIEILKARTSWTSTLPRNTLLSGHGDWKAAPVPDGMASLKSCATYLCKVKQKKQQIGDY